MYAFHVRIREIWGHFVQVKKAVVSYTGFEPVNHRLGVDCLYQLGKYVSFFS